jgi:formylglycine-generating enzyme
MSEAAATAEAPGRPPAQGMAWIPGGTFRMGSDRHYPEEAPVHRVTVDGFWMDRTPVTNRQFRDFVRATGHVTLAERCPDPKDYPGALPHMLYAGSLVFTPPNHPADLRFWGEWWTLMRGADWRHPYGPKSTISGLDNHPVVHVTFADALAYAHWAGKDLPTEAEWEFAARGGLDGAEFAWGDEFTPGGHQMANTWQGDFPRQNLAQDGFERTSPVTAFPPNGYSLYDMIGNVWEWTSDFYAAKHPADAAKACCIPENPRGGREDESFDPRQPEIRIPRRVLKGGSHLCAPNYCRRYRPAARHPQPVDTSASLPRGQHRVRGRALREVGFEQRLGDLAGEEGLVGGEALHGRDQEFSRVRLQQEALGARLQDLSHQSGRVVHGEDQDLGAGHAGADLSGRFDPVQHRKRIVEDNNVRTGGQRLVDRVLAVLGLPDHLPACLRLQDRPHPGPDYVMVVGDEDACHRMALSGRAGRVGRRPHEQPRREHHSADVGGLN